ncbi:MAG: LuxR C-terminal-related transcriptional regulator [Gammaproteobacteria bacterium]|nr:LuxR C-terminal-related transcriptional regulator [Gammaproteobacteria bacterium]
MKAQGQAVEIRESDLQFNKAETEQLLKQGGITLDIDEHKKLMAQIEGWITGLRLFCLAVDKGGDPKVYLDGIGGGAAQAQKYLVEQVWSQQLPEIQACLLKTSILDRLCAPLCEVLCSDFTGKTAGKEAMSGSKFMATIDESNLYGIQLETDGEWIRYHHLFQELLRSHLQKMWPPQDIAALHHRAAQWFAEMGLIEEGLKHAFAAEDYELAANIIEGARLEALNTDQWPLLAKWLDSLPYGVEESRPILLMSRAYVLMQSMRLTEIPEVMDKVVELEGGTLSDPMLAGELAFFRGIVAFFSGEVKASKQHFDEALRKVPETNLECRSEGEYLSYVALHLDGQGELAVASLQAAIQRNNPRSLFYQTRLMFGLSFVHALAGQWPESFRAAERLVEFSIPNNFLFALAWANHMQANASLQTGDFKEAGHYFESVFQRRYIGNRRAVIDALVGHALCLQLQGKEGESDAGLHEAQQFAYWTGDPTNLDVVDSGRARIALLRGDQDFAARWLATYHDKPEGPVKIFFLEYPSITACRVLVAKGTKECLEQAAFRLESLETESQSFNHNCQLVPLLVLKSVLALKQNRVQDALNILTKAVGLSWSGRWVLPFIEGGEPVAKLLSQLPENPEWGAFVPKMLARFDPGFSNEVALQAVHDVEAASIIDLTNREVDVLTLLCERLYDKEIAGRLNISIATVKTHLNHIYGKLGVASRREAVQEAKRLSLV